MTERSIEKHGFAVLPRVLPKEEVSSVIDAICSVSATRSRAGIRHSLSLAGVSSLARRPHLLEIAQAVLGSGALPFRATLFDKSPRANWLVVWHQDTALPLRERQEALGWGPWSVKGGVIYAHAPASALENVLALRVHLDDSTSQNGPLRVLPGTHTSGVLSDDEIQQLAGQVAPVECLAPRGGIVAMRPLLIHSSSKSQTEDPRRVLHIEYAASSCLGNSLELAVT